MTDTRTIQFPPLEVNEATQILKFLPTMAEFMDAEITAREEVIKILRVDVPIDRADVITILNKLADSKKKKRTFKTPVIVLPAPGKDTHNHA